MSHAAADVACQARRRATLGSLIIAGAMLACTVFAFSPGSATRLSPADAALKFNPNSATPAELMLLPGIGPALAENIVAYRQAVDAGPAFARPGDLEQVDRIGPATAARLAPMLTFENPPHRSPP